MKNLFRYALLLAIVGYSCKKDSGDSQVESFVPTPLEIQLPLGFGWKMFSIPADNPLTVEGVELGKKLFNDPILSANNTQSCASCHKPEFAYSDFGNQFSKGAFGGNGVRNTPALFNLGWNETYNLTKHRWFWDGGKADLEQQAVGPITNPVEMAADLADMVKKLQNHSEYPQLFKKVFGSDTITVSRVVKVISQFERTLISGNSPFDQAERRERQRTPSEYRGMLLFANERGDCFHCHGSLGSPFFTDFSFHSIGLDKFGADSGLYRITGNPNDLYKFRTPSLRNLLFTAPYMHDGRFKTLEEVIEFYSSGIKPSVTLDPNLEKHMKDGGLALNPMEKADLLAFLYSLTDSSFVKKSTNSR